MLLVFGNTESLRWRDNGLGETKCLAVLGLSGSLIIPQVFAGQLAGASKWCHKSNICCLGFPFTLIMENFKSRQNGLITSSAPITQIQQIIDLR